MDYKGALDRAAFAVRDKVGKVMSSGSEILSLRDRAMQYGNTSNGEVNALASAVASKANGLLNNYKAIEADSITSLGRANSMMSAMQTDPLWKTILSGSVSDLGWASLAKVNDYIGQAGGLTSALLSLSSRADSHLKAVAALRSDVTSLEDFAQGKGLKAALSGAAKFGGNYLSTLKWVAAAVIAGAAVIYLPKPRREKNA